MTSNGVLMLSHEYPGMDTSRSV